MKNFTKKIILTTSLSFAAQAEDKIITIADELHKNENVESTKEFIIEAELAPSFGEMQTGDYTLFAPNNEAYKEFSKDEIEYITQEKNIEQLHDLIGGHIVANKIDLNLVEDGEEILAVNDDKIVIEKDEDAIYVDDAKVLDKIEAHNGMVYVIDDVINEELLDALEDLAYLEN